MRQQESVAPAASWRKVAAQSTRPLTKTHAHTYTHINPAPKHRKWQTMTIISLWVLCYNRTGLFSRQGTDSSQDEIGASAILGAQLDDELGFGPVQVTTLFLLPDFIFHFILALLLFSLSLLKSNDILLVLIISSLSNSASIFHSVASYHFCIFRLLVLL